MTLALTGERLTIADIKHFLNNKDTVVITEEALARVKQSRAIVEGIINNKKTIYGITTGFGLFSDVRIDEGEYEQLQTNLIVLMPVVGQPFSEEVSLVMMILHPNTLLKDTLVRQIALVEQLVFYINQRIIPVIPNKDH